jgi:hypothetical protein
MSKFFKFFIFVRCLSKHFIQKFSCNCCTKLKLLCFDTWDLSNAEPSSKGSIHCNIILQTIKRYIIYIEVTSDERFAWSTWWIIITTKKPLRTVAQNLNMLCFDTWDLSTAERSSEGTVHCNITTFLCFKRSKKKIFFSVRL